MKSLLIPTDFSDTAKNSARYAAGISRELGIDRFVLYNAYSMPLATEMSWAVLQTEELQKASEENLETFREWLAPWLPEHATIETVSEFGFLTERIDEVAHAYKIDLIVMGVTGGNKMEEVLIGSNTVHIVENTDIPVLIVPKDAVWKDVQKIGWACDYKDVLKTAPIPAIRHFLKELDAKMIIIHKDDNPMEFDPDRFHNSTLVMDLLSNESPDFVNLGSGDFAIEIDRYATENNVDLVLVVPKKHGWLASLFRTRFTTHLVFHTHVPILCLRSTEYDNH